MPDGVKINTDEAITVVTVNYNTADFVGLLLESLRLLTKGPYRVIICDNGSKSKDLQNLKALCKDEDNIELIFNQQSVNGSIGHGEALDMLAFKIETPFFVVVDSDAVFLHKDWDAIWLSRINDKVKAIGTEASGNKPKDFPTLYAVLYETNSFRKIDSSFLPNLEAYKDEAYTDTGWQVREGFLNNGYEGETLEIRNTREYKEGPFREFTGVGEFYLKGREEIFVAHYGRGAAGGRPKFLKQKGAFKIFKRVLAWREARKEKKAWFNSVRQYLKTVSESLTN